MNGLHILLLHLSLESKCQAVTKRQGWDIGKLEIHVFKTRTRINRIGIKSCGNRFDPEKSAIPS